MNIRNAKLTDSDDILYWRNNITTRVMSINNNIINQKEHDTVCSDCSLASHQLKQASDDKVAPSHPIIELYKAYGFNKNQKEV